MYAVIPHSLTHPTLTHLTHPPPTPTPNPTASQRLRAGLMACLYTQALLTRSADAAATADAATLLGVDAARAVNLVPSFMELWSLPVQLAVAMWLLYTQVRFAFAAGVALCLGMLPVNRWLARRIQGASVEMMAQKDRREWVD